jgi:hypothetical protein
LAVVVHLEPACLALAAVVCAFRFESRAVLAESPALLVDEFEFGTEVELSA